jgi:hypothetical protein
VEDGHIMRIRVTCAAASANVIRYAALALMLEQLTGYAAVAT